MKKRLLFIFAFGFSFLGAAQNGEKKTFTAPANTPFRVIGYVSARNAPSIPDHTLEKLDIACYAFATIDSVGVPVVRDEKRLRDFVRRAHRLGVKVMISFNGPHALYQQMAVDPAKRKRFVSQIWRLVEKYRLDGVDNDWEFPRTTDGTAESNLALMQDFSRLCRGGKKQYLLTMAVTSGLYPGTRRDAICDELIGLVDWLNVMVYGNFSETEPYRQHSTFDHLEDSYHYYVVQRKMDPGKFVAGLPIYGLASGLPKRTSSASYAAILRQNGLSAVVTDSAQVSNRVHPSPYWVYYNGFPTIYRKVSFALDKGLGGVMFWEVGQDTSDGSSLIGATYDTVQERTNKNKP